MQEPAKILRTAGFKGIKLYKYMELNMENGSINPSEVATLSLLGGGGGIGFGRQFADDSSNAVRIVGSEKLSAQGHDFLSQQISDNADRNRDLGDLVNQHVNFNRVDDKIGTVATASAVSHNEIIREMNANAREAAKCCCEAKLLAVQNQAKTDTALAEIKATQVADARVADAVANATQNAKLDILLAERGRHHGGNG